MRRLSDPFLGGGPLKESNHRGSHLRRGLDISKCTLCFYSQFFLYSEQCSIYRILSSQNMHQDSGRLQEVKNNGKMINYQPRKVVVVTYRRGSSCKAFNNPLSPQYPHTNSPNWSLYISLKNKLREFG